MPRVLTGRDRTSRVKQSAFSRLKGNGIENLANFSKFSTTYTIFNIYLLMCDV